MTCPLVSRSAACLLTVLTVVALDGCHKSDAGTAPPQPASITNPSLTAPTATAGSALSTAPTFTVKDAGGAVLGNVPVTVVVSGGGGSLLGAPTRTSAGATAVGAWTLGTMAGVNSLTITVGGLAPLTITATGTPGAPAKVVASGGNAQTALAGAAVANPLGASVQDQYGNGIPNLPVTFQSTAGGGVVSPGLLTTNASGVASGAGWRLGNKGGVQTASATAGGFSAQFTASIQSTYPLDLRFYGPPMSIEAQSAFTNAVNRLRAAIISQVSAFQIQNINLADCDSAGLAGTLNEITQGVIIYASVQPIDGPGKILAQAGPCYIRGSSKLPFLGTMAFDAADIQNYVNTGRFEALVLHEMNHVLGLGTIWGLKSLLSNPAFIDTVATGSTNPRFTGSTAITNCLAVGGLDTHCAVGTGVAVEAAFGPGTADGHWRESLFDSELMTGIVESTPAMPWSIISVGSFQDLGYTINPLAADSYSVPSLLTMARLSQLHAESTHDGPWEMVRRPKFEISSGGRVTRIQEKK